MVSVLIIDRIVKQACQYDYYVPHVNDFQIYIMIVFLVAFLTHADDVRVYSLK